MVTTTLNPNTSSVQHDRWELTVQATSLTLTHSLIDVHGIHPRDETMVIPIPSFANDHNTWPDHIDANASTLVSTSFLFYTFLSTPALPNDNNNDDSLIPGSSWWQGHHHAHLFAHSTHAHLQAHLHKSIHLHASVCGCLMIYKWVYLDSHVNPHACPTIHRLMHMCPSTHKPILSGSICMHAHALIFTAFTLTCSLSQWWQPPPAQPHPMMWQRPFPISVLSATALKMPKTWPPCTKLSCGSSRSETLRKSSRLFAWCSLSKCPKHG